MEAKSLDQDFFEYWKLLSIPEKQSLYQIAKQYVALKSGAGPIAIDQYNAEIGQAMKDIDAGVFYTHTHVVEMSKGWLNGK